MTWTFEVTVTNPPGQELTFTGSSATLPRVEKMAGSDTDVLVGFALEVEEPTRFAEVSEDNGLPPNAYDLVLTARNAATCARALLDGSAPETPVP